MHEQNTEGKGKGEKKETQVIKKIFENKKLNYFNLIQNNKPPELKEICRSKFSRSHSNHWPAKSL